MEKILLYILINYSLLIVNGFTQPQFEWTRNYPMDGKSVAIDSISNIYVIGNDRNNQLHIIKYNSSGVTIWSRDMPINYGGTSVYSVCDKNGNFYFSFDYGDNRFFLTKYDSSGNHKWDKSYYPGGNNTYTKNIAIDTAMNIILSGMSILDKSYIYIIKFNSLGDTLWTTHYTGSYGASFPYSIFIDTPGNIYIAGNDYENSSNSDFLTLKYNKNGIQQWVKRYDGPYHSGDYAKCIKVDDDGYCYVTGYVTTGIGHCASGTIKYTPNGDSVWSRIYIPQIWNYSEYTLDLLVDNSKNVYVVGGGTDTTYSGQNLNGDRLIKYDINGNIIFNIIDTNAKELPTNICFYNNNIFLATNSFYHIYSSGYNSNGINIFNSYYPLFIDTSHHIYSSYKILSYKNDYLLLFGGGFDSSLVIKYSNNTGIINPNQNIISNYKLYQNYPNPFNQSSIIKFQCSIKSDVSLKIYDIIGREMQTLVNERKSPGSYEVIFDGSNLASGIYFYTMEINGVFIDSKKLVYIK